MVGEENSNTKSVIKMQSPNYLGVLVDVSMEYQLCDLRFKFFCSKLKKNFFLNQITKERKKSY